MGAHCAAEALQEPVAEELLPGTLAPEEWLPEAEAVPQLAEELVAEPAPLAGQAEGQAPDPEIAAIFTEEAAEVLETIATQLPLWRAAPLAGAPLEELRRAFHTLKGSGRMVGAELVGDLSWSVEHLLNRVTERALEPSPAVIEAVARAQQQLPALVQAFAGGAAVDAAAVRALQEAVESPTRARSAGAHTGRGAAGSRSAERSSRRRRPEPLPDRARGRRGRTPACDLRRGARRTSARPARLPRWRGARHGHATAAADPAHAARQRARRRQRGARTAARCRGRAGACRAGGRPCPARAGARQLQPVRAARRGAGRWRARQRAIVGRRRGTARAGARMRAHRARPGARCHARRAAGALSRGGAGKAVPRHHAARGVARGPRRRVVPPHPARGVAGHRAARGAAEHCRSAPVVATAARRVAPCRARRDAPSGRTLRAGQAWAGCLPRSHGSPRRRTAAGGAAGDHCATSRSRGGRGRAGVRARARAGAPARRRRGRGGTAACARRPRRAARRARVARHLHGGGRGTHGRDRRVDRGLASRPRQSRALR
ncbi:MAG: Hpt domain-containing protein [Gammaproteobacteria bacterium]|nr:Hpt domain-containing protein [Gammaproteobacteria bacterium]